MNQDFKFILEWISSIETYTQIFNNLIDSLNHKLPLLDNHFFRDLGYPKDAIPSIRKTGPRNAEADVFGHKVTLNVRAVIKNEKSRSLTGIIEFFEQKHAEPFHLVEIDESGNWRELGEESKHLTGSVIPSGANTDPEHLEACATLWLEAIAALIENRLATSHPEWN